MNQQNLGDISNMASATRGLRRVFIRDLILQARIGIHDHERAQSQPIVINIDASVEEDTSAIADTITDVVCYETLTLQIKDVIARGHTDLVEVLAENIADTLLRDQRIMRLRIRLEKPDAIDEAAGVGVEIERLSRRHPVISAAETT
ncbi:MAG TPA: dihydroneopterin aldolase [Rhodobiaceae bacterium]|nr:MAG: Dihydroneopterin aldolase [Rhodobiaceae bacterium UBA7378]HCQ81613.1 dihydroneopterin aldolase [Rhodobiaceae bacterium]|tara:strand:- start:1291 stop:1731 length:441 start_codon:yes stop_codon:yes gene_type:complete